MQDHFTKWVKGRAICGKEAIIVMLLFRNGS